MIYQTVNLNDFRDAFKRAGREKQFSYEGLENLFDFLSEVYEEKNFELNVIAICSAYSEYNSLDEYNEDYDAVESIEEVEDLTFVLRKANGESFIIQNF